MIVSEKTLELNVCAELLTRIRTIPGFGHAFWIGMKQDQEARNGIDEVLAGAPRGRYLALQFKAPKKSLGGLGCRYYINDRQNSNLLRLATTRPQAVHYVLPQYVDFREIIGDAPDLLRRTWSLPVWATSGLPPARGRRGLHRVETFPPIAMIWSDPFSVKLIPFAEGARGHEEGLLGFLKGRQAQEGLLPGEAVREWVGWVLGHEQSRGAVGQRFRGLGFVCSG